MTDGTISWSLGDDQRVVTLTLPTTPPTELTLDAAALDELLAQLGQFRAHMLPPAGPRDWMSGQRVSAMRDPRWVTEPEARTGQPLLHLLDPRFGWLHYLMPKDEAAKLGSLLLQQVS
jgi:hypothetical protein